MSKSDLLKNAIRYLQDRHKQSLILNGTGGVHDPKTNTNIKEVWPLIAFDWRAGVKVRAIAIPDIDDLAGPKDPWTMTASMPALFDTVNQQIQLKIGNTVTKMQEVDSDRMTFAPRIILYTNKFDRRREDWIEAFQSCGLMLDIVVESELFKSAFISYGGPDARAAGAINRALRAKGIPTWFFPVDALPGQKLHRVMRDGVNARDRVLLICSQTSLGRAGLLNELEAVLEREAREGGAQILIPVTLDNFVHTDWAPARRDLAEQVRSRVITSVAPSGRGKQFQNQMAKLVQALGGG